MIVFQKGIPGDGALIASTRQKAWAATYRGIFPDNEIDCFNYAWHIQRDEQRLRRPDFFYYLVMDGRQCVGYFSYGKMAEGAYKDFRFRLQSLYLLPDYQGQGIGKKIMEQVFDACREMGFDKLFWDCSPHNMPAIGFYEHIGGVAVGMDTGHENKQEDSCTFEYYFTKGE